jgi:prevent-host-death family protein
MSRRKSATIREALIAYPEPGTPRPLGAPVSEEVGVRDFRDHLSAFLERVKAGESFVITEHGRAVARVAQPERSRWDELVARGVIRPALRPATPIDVDSLPEIPGFSLSDFLISLRDAEYEAMNRVGDIPGHIGPREDPAAGA